MRLLLTRAAGDAGRTKAALEEMGHQVLVAPVIEMVALGAAWPSGPVDAVVASSAQAFALLAGDPAAEAKRLFPLWVVGARTATMARDRGFRGAATVADTGAELSALVQRAPTCPKRVAYLAGLDRRPEIEDAFKALGVVVDIVEIYEARAADKLDDSVSTAIEQGRVDGVIHFSRRSASLFCRLARTHEIERLAHYALSEDVAVPLRQCGCERVAVSEAPNEAALLDLVGRSV